MSNVATYDLARQGQIFHACSAGAVTLSALSTTATGLVLVNPFGSGKNIAVIQVNYAPTTAPAGASIVGIAMSPAVSATQVTLTTPLSIRQSLLDGTAGKSVAAVCSAATTVGTPVFVRALGGVVAASSISNAQLVDYTDGELILVPGTSLQLAYITTASVGLASITWTEYIPS